MSDDAPREKTTARRVAAVEFCLKLGGLAVLAACGFTFGVVAGCASVGSALIAAAYLP